ncbi:MAG: trypsin-like peptidase domain-containing protein [Bryobacteraceae bacterium]
MRQRLVIRVVGLAIVFLFSNLTLTYSQERVTSVPGLRANGLPPLAALPPSRNSQRIVDAPLAVLPPLAAQEIEPAGEFGLPRVGRNRSLPRTPSGTWTQNAAGDWYWTARVRSEGAVGVRLLFSSFNVQRGQVWVHDGSATGRVFGPYTGRGWHDHGDLWTELLGGDTAQIEYRAGDGRRGGSPPFEVREVFHVWPAAAGSPGVNTSCFLDEKCYESTPGVEELSRATVLLLFPTHSCSGTLINDRNNSETPYVLTAGHCANTPGDAQAMLTIFGYKSDACGGSANSVYTYPQVSGAELLHSSVHLGNGGVFLDQPDYALLQLSHPAPAGTYFAGWNTGIAHNSVTSISHPHLLPQQVAFGTLTGLVFNDFYRVNMSRGAVDRGSSGSGLFDENLKVVAVASFLTMPQGLSACDPGAANYYSGYTRFPSIYPGIEGYLEAPPRARLLTPEPESVLPGQTAVFTWSTPNNVTSYTLAVSRQLGGQEIFFKDFGTANTGTANSLPLDGSLVYVRLTTNSAAGNTTIDVTYAAVNNLPPVVSSAGDAASGSNNIAPGSWASVYGANLGPGIGRVWRAEDFNGDILPLSLAGTTVKVNGKPAAVSYASATQVNFQVPDIDTPAAGQVIVTTAAGASNPGSVNLQVVAPALFQVNGQAVAQHYTFTPIGNGPGQTAAKAGETITLWGTGCGPSAPPVPSGQIVQGGLLANQTAVSIGGQPAALLYAGVAGAGLCQFNVTIPAIAAGDQPVAITIGDFQTDTVVTIPVVP